MSKTAAFYFWFCDAANNLANIQGPVASSFGIWSEDGQDFQPIWNSMSAGDIFFSDVNTQWGNYASTYLKTNECSSMYQKIWDVDFYTPTFPVYHPVDPLPDTNLSYVIITGKPTINVGDYYFSATKGQLNQRTYITGEGCSMYQVTNGTSTFIGTNIDLPIGYASSDSNKNVCGANITPTLLQRLRINSGTPNRNNARYNRINNTTIINAIYSYIENSPYTPPPTDPYNGAGDSDTGGGGGTFDGSSDPVPVPSLPSVGATNTGFISLFVPTQSQLKQVADYLWSGLFDLSTYLKIFENPMDCILGLSVVPVTIPTSGSAQITVGNIELSGISLPLASQQYVEVDCGSIPFTDKFFGSYLDQDPYTKMALFVPYSGVHSVKADDIMGKTVNLKYHIDILTGSLVAFLTCGDSVLYEFNGACASNIPVNSMNYASTIENAIRIAVNIGTTVATAGASAPMTGAATAAKGATDGARLFGTAVNMAGSTAEGILSLKPNIDRAGSLGGTTGLMGNQTPYFIITRPRLCKPANQNTFKGYPSFIQVTISELIGQGYTEFDTVVLAGLYLTDGEKEELKQILESGVYL